jgi:ribosome-binding factor A
MAVNRLDKVNAELQRNISEIIRNKLKDPRITGLISVLRVDTAQDLKAAKVYISIFDTDAERAGAAFKSIAQSAGHIRGELARTLAMRAVPELRFFLDDSLAYSQKINRVIDGLKEDKE